jgi:uncharacterized phage-associated protein
MYSQDFDTAQYLINVLTPHYGGITPMKLQKLLYYVKAWGLVAGTELIVSDFKKWEYGPVQPQIYAEFNGYGKSPIPINNLDVPLHLKGVAKELTDFISESYASFHAVTLSKLTHQEDPWKLTPRNETISETAMEAFYRKLSFAGNFNPFDPEHKPYIPVQTDLSIAFMLDMSKKEASIFSSYPSFEYYKEQVRRTHRELKTWMESGLIR